MKEDIPFAEEAFKNFVENSCELVCCIDMDGKLVYVNSSWEEKMGFSKKEALSIKIWDLVDTAHIEKCKGHFENIKNGERPDPKTAGIETVFISKSNKPVAAELNNSIIIERSKGGPLIMCSFRDISSNQEAERRIKLLSTLVEQCDDMIAFKNTDLKVVAANDSYAKLSGQDRKSVV